MVEGYNTVKVKCECGNKVDVTTLDRLNTIAKPVDDKTHAALIGRGACKKCGKDVWIYSYIEMHEAQ